MSFTRQYDDPTKIKQQLQDTTFVGRYMLDKPGYGVSNLTFIEDPQIRLQNWGANINTNQPRTDIESDLFTLSRRYNRDLVEVNDHKKHGIVPTPANWGTTKPFVDESRASCPAWMYRTVENNRWEFPLINPQDHIERPFNYDVQTRIIEKDLFCREPAVPLRPLP